MKIKTFNLKGYACLYNSLVKLYGMNRAEAMHLVYMLNTANLETALAVKPNDSLVEATPIKFYIAMLCDGRPYKTYVQFYKSMEALRKNIHWSCINQGQRNAVKHLECIMDNVRHKFERVTGMDIDSEECTVYGQCKFSLIPDEEEPTEELLRDYVIYLLKK